MTDRELLELLLVKVDGIDSKVDNFEVKMGNLEAKVDSLEVKMGNLEAKVDSLEVKMGNLEAKVNSLGREVKDIQLTLENVTNKNISLIAEGHLVLNQKLDETLKVNHEKEMLLIRVNKLENEVRRLKERLETR